MKAELSECKMLASLVIFRDLYNNEKDIYSVIAELITAVIIDHGKYQFSLTGMSQLLNESYDFKIPEAVVKAALKRLPLKKTKRDYTVINKDLMSISPEYLGRQLEIREQNDNLLENLISYIELRGKTKLNLSQKNDVMRAFVSFMLDESLQSQYQELISAFIVKNKLNVDFDNHLSTIREGVILYSGLQYNQNINEVGTWNTNLVIYADTEILFSALGYNGQLCKMLFDDFFALVSEVNAGNKKRLINIKYFQEVKDEVDAFFYMAENIVRGRETLDPSKNAMVEIVNGCKTASDVVAKRTAFFQQLRSQGIHLDTTTDFYQEENQAYNIESKETLGAIEEDLKCADLSLNLRFLNYINILRKDNQPTCFEKTEFFLLTATSVTLKMAWHELVNKGGGVPLATSLDFLTNRLWFKLNKGFGLGHAPKSFDVIAKAQVVLSSLLCKSVSQQYEELQHERRNGTITPEMATARLIDLRQKARRPEDIESNNVEEVLDDIITVDDLKRFEYAYELRNREMLQKDVQLNQLQDVIREQKNGKERVENDFQEYKRSQEAEREAQKRKRMEISGAIALICVVVVVVALCVLSPIAEAIVTILAAVIGIPAGLISFSSYLSKADAPGAKQCNFPISGTRIPDTAQRSNQDNSPNSGKLS